MLDVVENEMQYVDVYRDACSETGSGNGDLCAPDGDCFGNYGLGCHYVSVCLGLV